MSICYRWFDQDRLEHETNHSLDVLCGASFNVRLQREALNSFPNTEFYREAILQQRSHYLRTFKVYQEAAGCHVLIP